jgi:AcrR family transcriptional regulator
MVRAASRRGEKVEGVGERIAAAALELLRERGSKGLSQPQVAKRAGVPQGHLTYYFPRKADLIGEVARRVQQQMQADLLEHAAHAGKHDTPKKAAVELLARLILDTERARSLLGLLVEAEADDAVRATVLETLEHGRALLASLMGFDPEDPAIDLVQAVAWGLEAQQLVARRSRARVVTVVERLVDWLEKLQRRDT